MRQSEHVTCSYRLRQDLQFLVHLNIFLRSVVGRSRFIHELLQWWIQCLATGQNGRRKVCQMWLECQDPSPSKSESFRQPPESSTLHPVLTGLFCTASDACCSQKAAEVRGHVVEEVSLLPLPRGCSSSQRGSVQVMSSQHVGGLEEPPLLLKFKIPQVGDSLFTITQQLLQQPSNHLRRH